MTALHITCQNKNKKIVEFLITYNSIINEQDSSLNTPLHIACQNGSYDIVEFLLNNNKKIK